MNEKLCVIAIIGPTASGKSDFAVEYALKHDGEIISADSRQIYRGLDIGTGKITREEMKGVPHHMLDIKEPGESFSVAEYASRALPIIEDILSRGKTPILCGGTGQYVHAVLYKQEFPKVLADEELRKVLERKSAEELFAELSRKDPARAETIDKHNKVRLVRALEILSKLPQVPSIVPPEPRFDFKLYATNPNSDTLRKRIVERLEKRLSEGMLGEVKNVLALDLPKEKLARCGIEYVELGKHLRGECSLEDAKKALIAKIWQYAKRQKTWNKKYFKEAEYIPVKK